VQTALEWADLDTPVGVVSVGCSAAGVAQVRFGPPPADARASGDRAYGDRAYGDRAYGDRAYGDRAYGDRAAGDRAAGDQAAGDQAAGELTIAARGQLAEYFRGQRQAFELPLDWSGTAGTQRHVLEVLEESVGYGQTTSYGRLAAQAGLTTASDVPVARLVGKIMGSNPIPVIVPCHRVLASDGLGGYSGGTGLEVKRWLLILEGALPPTLDWEPATPAS
jgi:methylated-DNA-[protein]-cysteine S-methyltransferase